MGRRILLRVKHNPELTCGKLYTVALSAPAIVEGHLQLTLHHLSDQQDGRRQVVSVPAEVYPESRTASLFQACGFDVSVDAELDPKRLEGTTVKLRFRRDERGEMVVDRFEPYFAEVAHETAEQPGNG